MMKSCALQVWNFVKNLTVTTTGKLVLFGFIEFTVAPRQITEPDKLFPF